MRRPLHALLPILLGAGLSLCLPLIACAQGKSEDIDQEAIHSLWIGRHRFMVEIADTPERRQVGLMNRPFLPPSHGMLFIFEREQPVSFWMKDTHIPLSIAYIDRNGAIVGIHDLTPYSLVPVPSSSPVLYALEVNRGEFEALGIQPGATIRW